jgi:hypothetical protein
MTLTGLEQFARTPEKSIVSERTAAKSAAIGARISQLKDTWQDMPLDVQQTILDLLAVSEETE